MNDRPVVGVNLLWLVPGVVGGSEESTVETVRAVAGGFGHAVDLRLFARADLVAAHPDLAPLATTWRPTGGGRPARIAAEATWLPARARAAGCALVHHAGGTAPPRSGPYVLTLHDVQPLERRGTHSAAKRAYLRATVPRSVRRARVVVVPSAFVRARVLDLLDADPARVRVVPHAARVLPTAPLAAVRRAHDLPEDAQVVLYPAITYPHKDHAVLVEAFARVAPRHPGAVLVLPGAHGPEDHALAELVARRGIADRVRRPGRVPEADLGALYRLATVVAVPSRYEGYGLPAAEGMAHGVPVVATAATALPEVVGDAGVLVAPGDVDAWAAALDELLGEPRERARLAAAGRERAAAWTWAHTAERLVDAYRAALA